MSSLSAMGPEGAAMKPLAIDLFCGLGGWAEGLLAEGYDVVGLDIERHVYGDHKYPAHLVLQDVRTIHGRQFKSAALIVASPPCQAYSYMAMPWRRGRQIERALHGIDFFPHGYSGPQTVRELNALFDACFRIQREACDAAGRHIPMVVENVLGAQKWVGRAKWHYGSYYLWGDVPALMPIPEKSAILDVHGAPMRRNEKATKNNGGSWFNVAHNKVKGQNPDGRKLPEQSSGTKCGGDWFSVGSNSSTPRRQSSKSKARKFASATIAKIPLTLSSHIGRTYRPAEKKEKEA